MHISCIICSDHFVPSDSIVTVNCGHCFHFHCLSQWLERSKTCPQCRARSTQHHILRVYLNINTAADTTEDAAVLLERLDNQTLQLREKERKVKELEETARKSAIETEKKAHVVRKLEKNLKSSNSLIDTLGNEIKILKAENARARSLEEEIGEMREKLRTMETIESALTGTSADVDEIIKRENDPRVLGVLVTSLKRELRHAETRRIEMLNSLKLTQSDLRREQDSRKKLEEKCANLEGEVYRLEEELKTKQNNSSTANSPTFDASETLPKRKCRLIKPSFGEIQVSDSPMFQLKSSSVGLSPLMGSKSSKEPKSDISDTFAILKKPRLGALSSAIYGNLAGASRKENLVNSLQRSQSAIFPKKL